MDILKTIRTVMGEVYAPKSPDENRFVKKHIIVKTKDANGNGDDVFQATNVKSVERTPKHGYNPGEDDKVYEDVSGESAQQLNELGYVNPGNGFSPKDSAEIKRSATIRRARAEPEVTSIPSPVKRQSGSTEDKAPTTSPLVSPKPETPKPAPQMSTVDPSKTVDQRMSELDKNLADLEAGKVKLRRGPTGKFQFQSVPQPGEQKQTAQAKPAADKDITAGNVPPIIPLPGRAPKSGIPKPGPVIPKQLPGKGETPRLPAPVGKGAPELKQLPQQGPKRESGKSMVPTAKPSTSRMPGEGIVVDAEKAGSSLARRAAGVLGKAATGAAVLGAAATPFDVKSRLDQGTSQAKAAAGSTAAFATLGGSDVVADQLKQSAKGGNPYARSIISAGKKVEKAVDPAFQAATKAIGDKLDPTFKAYDTAVDATSRGIEKRANLVNRASGYLSNTAGSALRSTQKAGENISNRVKTFGKSIFQ